MDEKISRLTKEDVESLTEEQRYSLNVINKFSKQYTEDPKSKVRHFIDTVNAVVDAAVKAAYKTTKDKTMSYVRVSGDILEK